MTESADRIKEKGKLHDHLGNQVGDVACIRDDG